MIDLCELITHIATNCKVRSWLSRGRWWVILVLSYICSLGSTYASLSSVMPVWVPIWTGIPWLYGGWCQRLNAVSVCSFCICWVLGLRDMLKAFSYADYVMSMFTCLVQWSLICCLPFRLVLWMLSRTACIALPECPSILRMPNDLRLFSVNMHSGSHCAYMMLVIFVLHGSLSW